MGDQLDPADHPDKAVRSALAEICRSLGLRLYKGGHWGVLRCTRGCCSIAVSGTPRNAGNHAKDLLREARKCPRDDSDPRNRRRPE